MWLDNQANCTTLQLTTYTDTFTLTALLFSDSFPFMKMGTQYFTGVALLGLLSTVVLAGCHPQEISEQNTPCIKAHKDREQTYKDALKNWEKLEKEAKQAKRPLSILPPKPEEPAVWDMLCQDAACGVSAVTSGELQQKLASHLAACQENVKVIHKQDKEEAALFADKTLRCLSPEVVTTADRGAACLNTALTMLTEKAQSIRAAQSKSVPATSTWMESACLKAHEERVKRKQNVPVWETLCLPAQCSVQASQEEAIKMKLGSHVANCQDNMKLIHEASREDADLLADKLLTCFRPEVNTSPAREDTCVFAVLTTVTEKAQSIRADKARAK